MNLDTKILNKMLVRWIQKHIKIDKKSYQTGFILKMQSWLHVGKSINATQHTDMLKKI